ASTPSSALVAASAAPAPGTSEAANVATNANVVNVGGKEAEGNAKESSPPRRGWWQRLTE
ncbi:MAG: hypothetical protein ACKVIF_09885, partial [Rhodospirillales bacterium]